MVSINKFLGFYYIFVIVDTDYHTIKKKLCIIWGREDIFSGHLSMMISSFINICYFVKIMNLKKPWSDSYIFIKHLVILEYYQSEYSDFQDFLGPKNSEKSD